MKSTLLLCHVHGRNYNWGMTRPACGSVYCQKRVEGDLESRYIFHQRRSTRADSGRGSTYAPVQPS